MFAFASAFYLGQKLDIFDGAVETNNERTVSEAGSQPGENERLPGRPVEKNSDPKNSFFNEEDQRRMQRAKEDLEKKFCTKHGLCQPPPPKPLTESVSEALYDTWLALKKIPSYWQRTANNIGDRICRWFSGDD